MTHISRTEFDARFALSTDEDAAIGFTAEQIAALNDQVFDALSEYTLDEIYDNRSVLNNIRDQAFNSFR